MVDVFTDSAFSGAQLAVFPESEALDNGQMQLIARELNLSETVFISTCDQAQTFRLRIFSPLGQRNFSGHATIAAGLVLGKYGQVELSAEHTEVSLIQNTGPISAVISVNADARFFIQFSCRAQAVTDRFVPGNAQLADMLSLQEGEISNSRYNTLLVACEQPYLIVPVKSFQSVRGAVFNLKEWSTAVAPISPASEILLFATKSDLPESNFHARLVGPQIGVDEDPPIATAMPTFAGYLSAHEHINQGTYSFTIDRGTLTTRKSVLNVELINQPGKENEIRVGGPAVVVGEGSIVAP